MDLVADSLIPATTFSLSALSEEERPGAFDERLRGSWEGRLLETAASFEMTTVLANVGGLVLSSSLLPTRDVARTPALVRAAPLEHYCIQVTFAASGLVVEIGGRQTHVAPRQPVFLDLAQPFKTRQGSGRSMQAFVPRAALDNLASPCGRLHGTSMTGAAANILVSHLQSLTDRLHLLPAGDAAELSLGTLHLVAASLATGRRALSIDHPSVDAALMRSACRLIDERLCDPDLDILLVARSLKISRATLYRLFEEGGGVARHIKERRLERIHAVLSAGDEHRPCHANIAEQHGFKSGAHFSRAFLEHFGYRPSEVTPARSSKRDDGDATTRGNSLPRVADWLKSTV